MNLIFRNASFHEIINKLYGQTILRYFWVFYVGMFIAAFKEQIMPILIRYWWIILLTAFIIYIYKIDIYCGYGVFWNLLLIAGLIGFAYRFTFIKISKDISYGLFLYHTIIVNVFVTFNLKDWIYALFVNIITIVLAYISTVTIGKVSAKKKQKVVSA